MKQKVKVGILGATGYTGVELCKIISRHPNANLVFLTSETYADKRMHEVFPELRGVCEHKLIPLEEGIERRADVVFSCLPHAKSADTCLKFLERRIRIIDLSADFRIESPDEYKKWYGNNHPNIEILKTAIFGLPELYRPRLRKSKLVANPGCFTVSILLPLIPLIHAKAIELKDIIVDSKTGVSGAGRSTKVTSLFVEANENFTPYSIGREHRHLAEIDQELSKAAESEVKIIFSPHLLPVNRGILSTIYVNLTKSSLVNKIADIYQSAFKKSCFIRITGNDIPQLRSVVNTNNCDIGWTHIAGTNRLIIVSAIDNLLRGASGQAVQNMNLMFGFEEKTALI
uniref:N-acetyl-gamma-glutamyl-phosphate reductase n=1 Tax=uncultured microorganism TaxID=358574 RepID=F8UGW8_9ZZZZ|nr:N-acetyl-gamma-glutamyl-phosphate reductase [uncultured microorganism]